MELKFGLEEVAMSIIGLVAGCNAISNPKFAVGMWVVAVFVHFCNMLEETRP